jgi:hypothetical protein
VASKSAGAELTDPYRDDMGCEIPLSTSFFAVFSEITISERNKSMSTRRVRLVCHLLTVRACESGISQGY